MGRMTTADYRHQGSGLDANQALTFPLSLSDPTTLDTRVAYDKNGRILGKRSGGVSSGDSAEYIYQSNSYKLERVEGRVSLSRDASYYGTFQYDVSGNMLEDRSKGVSLEYGPDGMPTLLRSSHRPPGAGELETLLYPFYDVSGQRVSEVAHPRLHPAFPVYFAGTAEGSEPESLYTVADVAEAWGDAHYRLNTQNLRALDSVVVYVVADDGYSYALPDTTGYSELYQGDTVVPVAVRGVEKYSAQYDSLLALRAGRPLLARHWVRLGGVVTAERTDHYDSTGAVAETRGFAYVQGRGTPIGRYVSSGGGKYQFFIKNHLGSTMRVVNADGSYATSPVFDYQAYGAAQVVREDTLDPMGPRYTGKGLDTEVNLYYFGARWYDQELGVWVTPDPARQFANPYSYGGDPMNYFDPYGLKTWSIFRPSKWERFGRHSQTYMRDHAIDDLQTVGGTVLINAGGLGACAASAGAFCAGGYYDGRRDEANIFGGGYYGSGGYVFHVRINGGGAEASGLGYHDGNVYGGEVTWNRRTGDINATGFNIGMATGGFAFGRFESNYKRREFQLYGTWNYLATGVVSRTRRQGWGAAVSFGGPCGSIHRKRNEIGGNFEGADVPQYVEDVNPDIWVRQPKEAGITHGGGIVYNERDVTGGGRQLVYDRETRELIRGQHEGTYDYIQPGSFSDDAGHFIADVVPYALCGD